MPKLVYKMPKIEFKFYEMGPSSHNSPFENDKNHFPGVQKFSQVVFVPLEEICFLIGHYHWAKKETQKTKWNEESQFNQS